MHDLHLFLIYPLINSAIVILESQALIFGLIFYIHLALIYLYLSLSRWYPLSSWKKKKKNIYIYIYISVFNIYLTIRQNIQEKWIFFFFQWIIFRIESYIFISVTI